MSGARALEVSSNPRAMLGGASPLLSIPATTVERAPSRQKVPALPRFRAQVCVLA
jgi:hypothetical protein